MTECRFCNEPIHLVGRWWELTEVSGDTYCPYGRECRVHESCPPECSSMTHEPAEVVTYGTCAEKHRPHSCSGEIWCPNDSDLEDCEHGVIRASCTVCGAL